MKDPYYRLFNYLIAIYIALILYASLYPIYSFTLNGLSPISFWYDQTPPYLSRFDIWINVLGYIPIGLLLVWRIYQKIEHLWAIVLAVILASMLSFCTEGMQTYILGRIPSKLDWYTNTLGGFMGATMGVVFSPIWVRDFALFKSYRRNFSNKYPFGLFLFILSLLSMLAPQPYWMSTGFSQDIFNNDAHISGILNMLPFYQNFLLTLQKTVPEMLLTLHQAVWPWVMFSCLTGISLAITLHINTQRMQRIWFILPLSALFIIRALFFMWTYETFSIPIEVWRILGISIVFVYCMSYTNLVIRGLMAMFLVLGSWLLSNALPANAYYQEVVSLWNANPYLHILGLFKWVYVLLPITTLAWIVYLLSSYLYFLHKRNHGLLKHLK